MCDEVVISGIGGRWVHSDTVQQLGENLLANKYLPDECKRWKYSKIPARGIYCCDM